MYIYIYYIYVYAYIGLTQLHNSHLGVIAARGAICGADRQNLCVGLSLKWRAGQRRGRRPLLGSCALEPLGVGGAASHHEGGGDEWLGIEGAGGAHRTVALRPQ